MIDPWANEYENAKLAKRKQIRRMALEMAVATGRGHIGSSLSCVDILCDLFYGPFRFGVDHFILSKGHASLALYPILADVGYFELELLSKFGTPELPEHPTPIVPGIETTAGSLGHGLAIGCGIAIAQPNSNVYVLLGDGECQEGSIWEAARFAGERQVKNLFTIVDCNAYAATGPTNTQWLENAFAAFNTPNVRIEHTIKGAGISFMEATGWHHQQMTAEQVAQAREELK